MKFRKKDTFDAIQWEGTLASLGEILRKFGHSDDTRFLVVGADLDALKLEVKYENSYSCPVEIGGWIIEEDDCLSVYDADDFDRIFEVATSAGDTREPQDRIRVKPVPRPSTGPLGNSVAW